MGANVYLAHPAAYGYKANGTTGDIIAHFVSRRAGERAAVRAFGFSAGSGATSVYFMTETGKTTMSKAIASAQTTAMALTAEPNSSNALAASDYVAIELDNGTFQVVDVATGGWSDFSIAEATDRAILTGADVYDFGAVADSNVQAFKLAVSTQTTKEQDGGLMYASGKNKAMLILHLNDTSANGWGSIDYVTIDYLNV